MKMPKISDKRIREMVERVNKKDTIEELGCENCGNKCKSDHYFCCACQNVPISESCEMCRCSSCNVRLDNENRVFLEEYGLYMCPICSTGGS